MFNTKLVLSYKGTNYCGFQIQNKSNDPTVQLYLDKALGIIYGEEIKTIQCSRTDAGVHAKGQVVNYKHPEDKISEPSRLVMAINANLPKDIRVLHAQKVSLDFHSRYNAKGKMYSYTIDNCHAHRPLTQEYTYHIPHLLDIDAMFRAKEYFLGTHDFLSFKGSAGTSKTSIRTVKRINLDIDDQYIKFIFEGDGFLYNMVRIMVGTLVLVGKGKLNPESVKDILNSKDRNKAGPTAPAQGLILEKIYY